MIILVLLTTIMMIIVYKAHQPSGDTDRQEGGQEDSDMTAVRQEEGQEHNDREAGRRTGTQ